MYYNYYDAVKDDVLEYIHYNINLDEWRGNRDSLEEYLNDTLWADDSVTGNASGSYTFDSLKAEEYLCGNWDLLQEMTLAYGYENIVDNGPEWCDVSIRCYVLDTVIYEVLNGLENELEEIAEVE